jgi:hypothetical protein
MAILNLAAGQSIKFDRLIASIFRYPIVATGKMTATVAPLGAVVAT